MSTEVTTKSTLTQLVQQAQIIEAALIESGGELTPELEALISNLDLSMADKIDGYSFILERFESEAAFFKARAFIYTKAANGIANFQKKLEAKIKEAMIAMNVDEVSGKEVRFKLKNCALKLVIENEMELAPAYQKIVQTVQPDKEKIKEDLSFGLTVKGARLEGGKSLTTYIARKKGE